MKIHPTSFITHLAFQVSTRRVEKQWSRSELARRAHVSLYIVHRLERGETYTNAYTIQKLAYALRCSPAELVAPSEEVERFTDARAVGKYSIMLGQFYRATCQGWSGPPRDTYDEAMSDAGRHAQRLTLSAPGE